MSRAKSINRFQYREAEKKIVPAIKLLSKYMHSTSPEAPEKAFFGYEVPAGEFKDKFGVPCQLQVRVVRTRTQFIKENEIKPIINKWAIMFRVRLFLTVFIDKLFNDDRISKSNK